MSSEDPGVAFDLKSYEARSRSGRCFVCAIVSGTHDQPVHAVYEDSDFIAFLGGYPRLPVLRGYVILSPRRHVERVLSDFTLPEYLALQSVAWRIGRAVESVVPTERLYLLSLGSMQGNAHVHWHLAPLPPGVPYGRQQFAALMPERTGLLDVSDDEQAALARQIRAAVLPAP